jgi:hypothetical protein
MEGVSFPFGKVTGLLHAFGERALGLLDEKFVIIMRRGVKLLEEADFFLEGEEHRDVVFA